MKNVPDASSILENVKQSINKRFLKPFIHLLLQDAVGPDLILMDHNVRHIRLTNFWKVSLFAEWTGLASLISRSHPWSIPGTLWGD
ncbi:hypothetical protein TNCV_2128411 [Trichonephila clavipes]|nr:hypothetical protein TNCV_2128411 [Trichonephila clavipes]